MTFVYRPTCGSIYTGHIIIVDYATLIHEDYFGVLMNHGVRNSPSPDDEPDVNESGEWDFLDHFEYDEFEQYPDHHGDPYDRQRIHRWHADGTLDEGEEAHATPVTRNCASKDWMRECLCGGRFGGDPNTSKPFQMRDRDRRIMLGTNQRQLVGDHDIDEEWEPPVRLPKRWARKDNLAGIVTFRGTGWTLGWHDALHETRQQYHARSRRTTKYKDHHHAPLANPCADVRFEEWCRECEDQPYVPYVPSDRESWLISLRRFLNAFAFVLLCDTMHSDYTWSEGPSPAEKYATETFRVSDHW